jgi:hypothetical protein
MATVNTILSTPEPDNKKKTTQHQQLITNVNNISDTEDTEDDDLVMSVDVPPTTKRTRQSRQTSSDEEQSKKPKDDCVTTSEKWSSLTKGTKKMIREDFKKNDTEIYACRKIGDKIERCIPVSPWLLSRPEYQKHQNLKDGNKKKWTRN